MKKTILEKYAHVLIHYSLFLKPGDKFFVRTTTLAEPLIKELYREATRSGVIMEVFFDFAHDGRQPASIEEVFDPMFSRGLDVGDERDF